jgi:hypothetical protein
MRVIMLCFQGVRVELAYGVFTLEVKSALNENLGGTQC